MVERTLQQIFVDIISYREQIFFIVQPKSVQGDGNVRDDSGAGMKQCLMVSVP